MAFVLDRHRAGRRYRYPLKILSISSQVYRDELDAILIGEHLKLLARNDPLGLSYFLWDNHLKLRGNGYGCHCKHGFDESIAIR